MLFFSHVIGKKKKNICVDEFFFPKKSLMEMFSLSKHNREIRSSFIWFIFTRFIFCFLE